MRTLLVLGLVGALAGTAEAGRRPFRAVALPLEGKGYLVPATWATRGLHWGTPELVGLLKRAAARVRAADKKATVYICDLSLRSGAATEWHRSHRLGIDADILYFARGPGGREAPPPRTMFAFDESDSRFDVTRNWLLVKALITDPAVDVTTIFVADWIRDRLIDHARAIGEPMRVIDRAALVLAQPSDSLAHDDHMHVRIAAPTPVREA